MLYLSELFSLACLFLADRTTHAEGSAVGMILTSVDPSVRLSVTLCIMA